MEKVIELSSVKDRLTCGEAQRKQILALALTACAFLPFFFGVAALAATALWVLFHAERRREALRERSSRYVLTVVIVTCFIGAVHHNLIGILYSLLMAALLLSALYLRSGMTLPLFERMMDAACACGAASAAVGVLQKLYWLPQDASYRPVSLFTNANYFAAMMEFLLLIAMYRLFSRPQRKGLPVLALLSALAGLYCAASLSAVFAAGVAAAVMLLVKQRLRLLAGLSAAAVAAVLLVLAFPALFPRTLAAGESWEARFSIWHTAVKGILAHPLFGEGAAAYRQVYPRYFGYETYHAHNLLLDMLLNFGFIGTAALGAYFFLQLRVLLLRFRSRMCEDSNVLLLAALVAVLVHGLTDVTIFWVQTGWLFALLFTSTGVHAALLRPARRPAAAGYRGRNPVFAQRAVDISGRKG